MDNPKLCECGCGQPAPIAKRNENGYLKGQPKRFIRGHQVKRLAVAVGDRFGRGVVIEAEVRIPRAGGRTLRVARLLCDCGNEYTSSLQALVGETTPDRRSRSCGCFREERRRARSITHGMSDHPLHPAWKSMIARCSNPDADAYHNYGGRGITVCERWQDVRLFVEDIERDLGPRPEGCTLDRINNDGNYEPGNVRWADWSTQRRNQRPMSPEARQEWTQKMQDAWALREPTILVCEWCGKKYQNRSPHKGRHNFCGGTCKSAARRASGVDDEERTCHCCGTVFVVNRYAKTRHCSRSCITACRRAGGCPE